MSVGGGEDEDADGESERSESEDDAPSPGGEPVRARRGVRLPFDSGVVRLLGSLDAQRQMKSSLAALRKALDTTSVVDRLGLDIPGMLAALDTTSVIDRLGLNTPGMLAALKVGTDIDRLGLNTPGMLAALDTTSVIDRLGLNTPGMLAALKVGTDISALSGFSDHLKDLIGARTWTLPSHLFETHNPYTERIGQLLATVERYAGSRWTRIYPDNLAEVDDLFLAQIREVTLEHGIPLYGVPRAAIVSRIVAAKTLAERRAIL